MPLHNGNNKTRIGMTRLANYFTVNEADKLFKILSMWQTDSFAWRLATLSARPSSSEQPKLESKTDKPAWILRIRSQKYVYMERLAGRASCYTRCPLT